MKANAGIFADHNARRVLLGCRAWAAVTDRKQHRSQLERVSAQWTSRLLLFPLPAVAQDALKVESVTTLGDEQRFVPLLPLTPERFQADTADVVVAIHARRRRRIASLWVHSRDHRRVHL